jgi:hypothetical protein
MRTFLLGVMLLTLAGGAAAQGRARLGPTISTMSIEDGSGTSHSFPSFGGTFAFITGDDGEIGFAVSRYADLSDNTCTRQLTFFGVESNYYPVGPKGVAPFASSALGLARVTDQDAGLLGICSGAQATNELGLGFGLGVRVNLGNQMAGFVEGRFFQVPNSAIQALEARANVSVAFGKPRTTQLASGTLGPAVGVLVRLSGPMEGRGPSLGVRFRRDTKKSGTLGLQVDYVPLRITQGCSSDCEPIAILFAPGYEASVHTPTGRFYGTLGLLLAGFPSVGADRGIAQGAHGGLGVDIFSGSSLMVNVNGRVLWLQRNNRDNAFLVQVGASLSPRLAHTGF